MPDRSSPRPSAGDGDDACVAPEPATQEAIRRAAEALRSGRLVVFPTETVYGLGADARSEAAVAAIYAAKGRPAHNPCIVHVPDMAAVVPFVDLSPTAARLADRFWPGPLTLVLRRRPDGPLAPRVSAGAATVAVRAPAHPIAQALLRSAEIPIAAPSANRSGAISPTTAEHVRAEFARGNGPCPAIILDGGACRVGVESTVLDLSRDRPRLLRPGGVTREAIEQALGMPLDSRDAAVVMNTGTDDPAPSPGLLSSHYAPARPVRLNATSAAPGEALLGFGGTPGADLDLSPSGDLDEAARNLFAMLRALDSPPFGAIAVAPIPAHGLGVALNDRLARAAAPRPGGP
ncbi:L-threonylcarbamoyladenylate synthase [Rhodospira trueperi]|uniref:Threonylcarbamoyl-AMP synthase n=1 Tax=Rhodospira trueperi TaxID=69960 RepID=A0A1G6Z2K8_9PROT|nr:L-threonylcarbamoyladenylate synthase [Rhodospira trueperi]SDD96187.1 L-threonylcarbamoyladenylate synthase [Rhodospira trueperi]